MAATGPTTAGATQPDWYSADLDARWPTLKATDAPLRQILNNPLADRLRLLAGLDNHQRQLMATDAWGDLIAADAKTGDFFQADEDWWQTTYAGGVGRPYISSVVINPATGGAVVALAVPIYDDQPGPRRILGVLKDKIDVTWVRAKIQGAGEQLLAMGQVLDLATGRTVVSGSDDPAAAKAVEEAYRRRAGEGQQGLMSALLGELVIGKAYVPLDKHLRPHLATAQYPHWEVLISNSSRAAMEPVYRLALIVAAVGVALILVLFILGVGIANREIILPILRLRAATAAVGRGELNVRLLSAREEDPTFRGDELGELARDFDDMTRQLQRNVGQLARSNEAKRRFLELAGHELRTPVTYILSASQLGQRQLQTAQSAAAVDKGQASRNVVGVTAALGKIAAKAERLSKIIDNLLKLVNNDQFTTRLARQPIAMRALVLQVCNDARPFISERKQQLVVDIAENLPTIEGDRDKLEDVLTNLLSNAIRFSPDGSTVKFSAHVIVGDMLEILVEDSGPGIPAADLADLFEPFYTGRDTLHHHSGTIEFGSKGAGLGLAIVRRFVEIHNGVVRAHATGHGTQFQILLPLNSSGDGAEPGGEAPGGDLPEGQI